MTINRRQIFKGKVVDLGIEHVTPPNRAGFDLEVIRHPGGAAIVAIDDQSRVCLVRQYRHAAGGWIWELPAGKLEPDEPAFDTAQRELTEEAGVIANTWVDLGFMWSTPGFCDEKIYLYLATELTMTDTDHEEDEVIEVHWMEFDQAWANVEQGEINDSKTIAGLMRARSRVGGDA